MSALITFAGKVVGGLKLATVSSDVDKELAFDPSIIIVIAEALVPLIQAIQKCMADMNDVPEAAGNITLLQRVAVRQNLRKGLVDHGGMSPREFAKNARGLVHSVVEAAKNSTGAEIQAVVDEVA